MMSKLISLLCCSAIVTALVAPVLGQPVNPPGKPNPAGQAQPNPGAGVAQTTPAKEEKVEHRPPAAEYALAMIATLSVLIIVCMPSRKR
jgi:hypothetical protein